MAASLVESVGAAADDATLEVAVTLVQTSEVAVKIDDGDKVEEVRAAFEAEVTSYPEVLECSVVTGQAADYLLKAVLPDMQHYEQFLLGRLTRIPGVTGVHSSFELRRVVQRTVLPLDYVDGA